MDLKELLEFNGNGGHRGTLVGPRGDPEDTSRKRIWKMYRDLYSGGQRMKDSASEYIRPRFREPSDVYMERLWKVFYENYIGSIVAWYGATLFRREAVLTCT